jgi:hypothetical protein
MNPPAPTYANRWDRLTYLLAEYKIPLCVVLVAAIIAYAHYQPALPTPPEHVVDFAIAAGILSLPSYAFGRWLARKLHARNMVKVIVADAGTDERVEPLLVPPQIWTERETEGPPAYRMDDDTWLVTDFDWLEDVEQLRVRGCWKEVASPVEVWKAETRVDTIFDELVNTAMKYTAQKSQVAAAGVQIHDNTAMEYMEIDETGKLPDGAAVTEVVRDLENKLDDVIDLPSLEDDLENDSDGDRIDEPDAMTMTDMPPEAATDGGFER